MVPTDYETIMFTTVFTTAFFGLFRVSEVSTVLPVGRRRQHTVRVNDVMIYPDKSTIILRSSKTGQKPYLVELMQRSDNLCPVQAMVNYLALRPRSTGPLFVHIDGKPLMDDRFRTVIQKIFQHYRLPLDLYTGHGFHIGGPMFLFDQGLTNEEIKKHGRWSSNTFIQYLRPVPVFPWDCPSIQPVATPDTTGTPTLAMCVPTHVGAALTQHFKQTMPTAPKGPVTTGEDELIVVDDDLPQVETIDVLGKRVPLERARAILSVDPCKKPKNLAPKSTISESRTCACKAKVKKYSRFIN